MNLPDKPNVMTKTDNTILAIILSLTVFSILMGFWITALIQLGILAGNILMIIFRYSWLNHLYKEKCDLIKIQKIIDTPMMREEGNSIIFSFLKPSDRLLNKMMKIIGKKNKKEQK